MIELRGEVVILRPVRPADFEALLAIRSTPEVSERWSSGGDIAAEVAEEMQDDEGVEHLAIVHDGRVAGMIQFHEENDPKYRHGGIDLYLDPAIRGRGIGTDAVRAVARYLLHERGHHRLVIDPAADNEAAIRCYSKVGFRPAGLMRQYERGPDGTWHDGLLMDLIVSEFQG
jgi:aminoglycoside 6'-N-acetyltransferase